MIECPDFRYLRLDRGGICISNPSTNDPREREYLNVQIGIPPETIKDTMRNPDWAVGVPKDFIVPGRLLNLESHTTLAELEFPG